MTAGPGCPLCDDPGCHYWELRRTQAWHPAAAPLDDRPADGHLAPVWRATPSRTGVATVGVDPREAVFLLANGLTIDGQPWRVSLEGCDGRLQRDGRVQLRISLLDPPEPAYEPVTR